MKTTAFALGLALAAPSVLVSAPVASSSAVIEEVMTNGRAYEIVAHLTDRIGPRLAGSPQAELAVRWTAEELREMGLDVRLQPVTVPHWVRGLEHGWLPSHNNQKIVLTALGGSVATPASGIDAEVVSVRSWEELEALGDSVRGKIVLYNLPMSREKVQNRQAFEAYSEAVIFRGRGASRAAAQGAVAALVRSVTTESLRTPHTGALRYDPEQPKIPAAAVTLEDADLIQRLLDGGERVTMHLVLTPRMLPDVESANVIAELRGSELPEEVVLVGGHLDSWDLATGAIDNASGVAMSMETMRAIRVLGLRPRRTIRMVLFMNEENGLSGARAYEASVRENLDSHFAVVESDAGAAEPIGFVTTLTEEQIQVFRALTPAIEELGARMFVHSESTGADTSPLTRKGVPGFGVIPDPLHYFDYHHTDADTFDKIDRAGLTRSAAAVAGLVWSLANTDQPVPRGAVAE